MPNKSLSVERVLTILAETPPRIAALTAGLAPAKLRTTPSREERSANDVLAHLRACAGVWGNCIAAIITQDRPTLRAVNPRTWIEKTDCLEQEFQPSLRAFAKQRTDLLAAVLAPLAPEGWSRTATVTGAGKVLERTVLFYGGGLRGMNGRTSSRSHTSPPNCTHSSGHPLIRRPDGSTGMEQGGTRWTKSIYIKE